MTAQTGEVLTVPSLLFGDADGYGSINISSLQTSGIQDGYGYPLLTSLAASQTNPIPYYALACFDNTNVRHYWVDTSISLVNAPPGFTYIASTLVVEGKF